MSQTPDFDVLLLDIEGTTTPIAFVHEVLFPFAREHVGHFLRDHWDEPGVQQDVAAMRVLASADKEEGRDTPQIPESGGADETRAAVVATVESWMDDDRKVTPLKSLQGRIWKHGYESGELKATLFPDVAPVMSLVQQRGVPIYIYSSGSIAAQKLLFSHTEKGDLTGLLSGYFDTTTGSKKESASYAAIARSIGAAPERILFLTDVVKEADCAAAAGFQAGIMSRPGNKPQPEHSHPVYESMEILV